jgi:hypothetical protein
MKTMKHLLVEGFLLMIMTLPKSAPASQVIYSRSGIGTYYYDIHNPYVYNYNLSSMNMANDITC